jgi:hypothetical protein
LVAAVREHARSSQDSSRPAFVLAQFTREILTIMLGCG